MDFEVRQLVERYLGVWNGDSLDTLDTLLTDGFVRHISRFGGPANSPDMLKSAIAHMRQDVPDLLIRIDDIILSGNNVVFR